jgi:hypothetical protein
MSDHEQALARQRQSSRIREGAFVALREHGLPLSATELIEILRPTVGEPSPYHPDRLLLGYSDVWLALKTLERDGAITSVKVYNARLWTARG